jgi:hypothetical protein
MVAHGDACARARYDRLMARGWESKSIEAQQEEAQQERGAAKEAPTPEELERRSRRGTLALARKRAEADLERATTDAHRAMLKEALAELDRQLKES